MTSNIEIYTDGACKGNPGPGGWAAVIRQNRRTRELSGSEASTTNNRMEILAAIKGLEVTPEGSSVIICSDSQYLINTMTKSWSRKANLDLWGRLDVLVGQRSVAWEWVRGHAGHPGNERADKLAEGMAASVLTSNDLTHLDNEGMARMVDVGAKAETDRVAVARGSVIISKEAMQLVSKGLNKKGDVLSVARIAGIMGAKRTSELVPLCHPLPLGQVTVDLQLDPESGAIQIEGMARATARTGVEMEALTAVLIAALTVYDMCKSVDRGIRIHDVRLIRKAGGRSGDFVLE